MISRRRAIALLLAALAGACGVPTQDTATRVPKQHVPFGLAAPASQTTVTTAASAVDATIFLVEGNRLVASTRRIAPPVSVDDVLDAVVAGPTETEARAGRRSAVVGAGLVNRATTSGALASVDLGPRFTALPSDEQVLALGQVVLSATSVSGVDGVAFTLDGAPIPVPRADGSLTNAPVGRGDYAALLDR